MSVLYLVAGALLLLFGRRMFWLFVAAAGFGAGMFLAREQFQVQSTGLVLAIAFTGGLLGALLAFLLQKIAVALAGFAAGAYLGMLLMTELNAAAYTWAGFAVGGIVGALLLLTVFEWALVILSSLVGAALVSDGAGAAMPEYTSRIYLVALVVGLVVQGVQLQAKREPARAEPRR